MKERWKEVTTKSREKRDQGKYGGELGIMEYVSRIVELRYWQPYRLSPLKMSWPPFGLPTHKKLAPPLRAQCEKPKTMHYTVMDTEGQGLGGLSPRASLSLGRHFSYKHTYA